MSGTGLELRIRYSYLIAGGFAAIVIGFYIGQFSHLGWTALSDPAGWGQFGDYVGGLLNPIVATLAFYWLTQSVKIQHKEMSETRVAVVKTAISQEHQARSAENTARINASAGLLSTYDHEIDRLAATQKLYHSSWVLAERGANLNGVDQQNIAKFSALACQIGHVDLKRQKVMENLALLLNMPELIYDNPFAEEVSTAPSAD